MPSKRTILPQSDEAPSGLCECGCGQAVGKLATYTRPERRYWTRYPVPYLPGHRPIVRCDRGRPRPYRRYRPTPEEIPLGLCECGCGQPTEIATRTYRQWRWFNGHPKPFVKGHHARHNHLSNRGPDHPAWKGGRWIHKTGYIYVYAPDHPAATMDGYVLEHRLVVEQTLGRPLEPHEHIHHMNHDRADNHSENLMVLTNSEHGQLHGTITLARVRAARGHRRVTVTCATCGATFTANKSNHRRYCSLSCAARARRRATDS